SAGDGVEQVSVAMMTPFAVALELDGTVLQVELDCLVPELSQEIAMPPTRSERKRGTILDAGRELFLTGGYQGTSVDQIAARAAVSKQTVCKHFGDKQRLPLAIVSA